MTQTIVPPTSLLRRARGALIAMVAAFLGAAPEIAPAGETDWRVYQRSDRDWRGAVICPVTEPAGEYVCVALDCRRGNPMAIRLTASRPVFPNQGRGGDLGDALRGLVVVDDRMLPQMTFFEKRGGQAEPTEYASEIDHRDQGALIAALRSGERGVLVLGEGGSARRLDFALSGADRAIGEAYALCPISRIAGMELGGPYALPSDRPVPGDRIERLRRGCAALGEEVTIGEGFARTVNVNGDGAEDLILDYGALSCGAERRPFCTEAGCVTELWLEQNHRLQRVVAEPLSEIALPGDGIVELRRAEGACGGPERPCVTRFRVAGDLVWLAD